MKSRQIYVTYRFARQPLPFTKRPIPYLAATSYSQCLQLFVSSSNPYSAPGYSVRQKAGLILGPLWLVASQVIPAPDGLSLDGWTTAGIALFMVTWWISEAIPIPATSLLPLVLFPLMGAGPIGEIAAPYAHQLIFLFVGGLLIATAMVRWNLHRRLALHIIQKVGTSPRALILGSMVATAFLSMWVSNTATAVMMLPVALSVIALAEASTDKSKHQRFALVLLLCVAYGANIGGMGTLIGTPPNAFMAAFFESEFGVEISFARWLVVGVPLVAIGIPLTYLALTRVVYPIDMTTIVGTGILIDEEIAKAGPITRGERVTALVFLCTALLWITRPLLAPLVPGLSDSGIAMLGGLALFVIPVDLRKGQFAHSWEAANKMPWGTILLFGGGLSLAASMSRTGLADWIGNSLTFVDLLPTLLVILVIAGIIVFLTELTSNSATTATFLPILAALAIGMGEDPRLLAIPAVLAASCAFMLPVATPPNAIVHGSERVPIASMARAGLVLNVVFLMLVTVVGYVLAAWVFGIQVGVMPGWAGMP